MILGIQKETEIPGLLRPKVLFLQTSVSYEVHPNRRLLASLFCQEGGFRTSPLSGDVSYEPQCILL